jgi:very-short-patch-repair endonuclease
MKYIAPTKARTRIGNMKSLLELRKLARDNRINPTKAESLMWNLVLKKRFLRYKFLRQKPIDRFILDFYCSKLLLAIEIDGNSHDCKENYDLGRDELLGKMGIITVRYPNETVLNNIKDVYNDLNTIIRNRESELLYTETLSATPLSP